MLHWTHNLKHMFSSPHEGQGKARHGERVYRGDNTITPAQAEVIKKLLEETKGTGDPQGDTLPGERHSEERGPNKAVGANEYEGLADKAGIRIPPVESSDKKS
jgi:hypothetical protein